MRKVLRKNIILISSKFEDESLFPHRRVHVSYCVTKCKAIMKRWMILDDFFTLQ
eukprot:UN24287